MRITVNRELCAGHAQCEDVLPEVFGIDDEGRVVLHDAAPAEVLRAKVEAAVRLCPVGAIDLAEA